MKQIFDFQIFQDRFLNDTKGHTIEAILVLAAILTHFSIKSKSKLGFPYWWYFVNAFLIHWYLDGLVGIFGQVRGLHYLYYIMDPRYWRWDLVILFVCQLEFWVMGPLCFIVAIMFKTAKNNRDIVLRETLAITVSVLHIFGTLLYLFGALVDGFKDNCGLESCFSFSLQNIFFFWGCCVFANPWWIYLPIKEIMRSYRVLEQLISRK